MSRLRWQVCVEVICSSSGTTASGRVGSAYPARYLTCQRLSTRKLRSVIVPIYRGSAGRTLNNARCTQSRPGGLTSKGRTEHARLISALISRLGMTSVRDNNGVGMSMFAEGGPFSMDPSFLFETPAPHYFGREHSQHRHRRHTPSYLTFVEQ